MSSPGTHSLSLKRVSSALFAVLVTGLVHAAAKEVTPSTIENSLREVGGKATLEKYFPCDADKNSPYQKIASGSPQWVALAVKLLDYSDACYTEGIQASLGQAMGQVPANILPYVGQSTLLSAERICLPFISNEQSLEDQIHQVRRVKKSISSVKDPRISKQRQACLETIARVEENLVSASQPSK